MEILEIKNLSLSIDGSKILDNLNLDIWANHIHALVDPNGAGKSSLAFAIMGLEGYQDIEGDIIFKGESLSGLNPYQRAKKGITLAWQEPARYEGLTVKQFLTAAANNKSDKVAEEVLSKVGMNPDIYLKRVVDDGLSGGERKKIELASILAMSPDLVLLDEPDSGIDVASLERIFQAIKLLKQRGSTVILITHSATVLKEAEHAFLMCCGNIVDKGKIEKIDSYFEQKCIPCDHKNRPEYHKEF